MNELQKIKINARPPVNITVNGENDSINTILEYFDKQDYTYVIEYCGISIKEIIKNLP